MTLVNSRTVQGRCPACGAAHAACGTAPDTVPVDKNLEVAVVGGPLKKYEVTMPSGTVTTMKLNEADAKRMGVLPEEPPQAEQAAPSGTAASDEPAPAKARSVRNKSRTAANKDGGAGGGDD